MQHILWPFLNFGLDTAAFFTNRSDLSDFLPDVTKDDYQRLVDAINQRYGIAMQTGDCGRIYQILERIRDDERANKVWQQH
ncbi:hypothetical protein [Methylomonas sp. YC3]